MYDIIKSGVNLPFAFRNRYLYVNAKLGHGTQLSSNDAFLEAELGVVIRDNCDWCSRSPTLSKSWNWCWFDQADRIPTVFL